MPTPNQHQLPLTQAMEELEKAGRSVWKRVQWWISRMGYTGVGITVVAFVTIIMVLRFYGLPDYLRDYLLLELEARGYSASVKRLHLDPTGGVVADQVVLYRNVDHRDILVQVDHVRIGFAWFSWWQGKPLIQSASVRNATVKIPITSKTNIEVKQANAVVDFGPDFLQIRRASARLLNMEIDVKGRVTHQGVPHKHNTDKAQDETIERTWKQIESAADDFDTEHPMHLQIDVDVDIFRPYEGKVSALLDSSQFRWRGCLIDEMSLAMNYQNHVASLDQFRIKMSRGELDVTGEANLLDKNAHAELFSNLDFTPLASAFGGKVQDAVGRLSFDELPVLNGRMNVSWKDPVPLINVQADVDWRNFSYSQTAFDQLTVPVAYDGSRLFIPDAELTSKDGAVKVELLYDRSKPEVKGQINSNLNPTCLKGMFGVGADRFLDSLAFNQGGPTLQLNIAGQSQNPRDWTISGKASATNFSYKNVAMDSLTGDFNFKDMQLSIPDLLAKRKEGQVTGGITEDFGNHWVRLTNLQANVLVSEVAPVLGDKFVGYIKPYTLDKPPALKVDGLVDLNEQKSQDPNQNLDTDLKILINSSGTLSFLLYGKKLNVENPQGILSIKNRDMTVHIDTSTLYDGPFSGDVMVHLFGQHPDYHLKLSCKREDFKLMMSSLFGSDKSSGRFDLDMELTGKLGDIGSINGAGTFAVDDGLIMSVPVFSSLTYVMDNLLPGFGISKADHAKATFSVTNGDVNTKDLTISSIALSMIGGGDYNLVTDNLDMDMRVNVKGILGPLFFPVSKIFEYHGVGPLKDVKWEPKNF